MLSISRKHISSSSFIYLKNSLDYAQERERRKKSHEF